MVSPEQLTRDFFFRPTLSVSKDLLGQRLVLLDVKKRRLVGIITETEAYIGTEDLACHARVGKTRRNAVMWGPPGYAYVYFAYGIHWLLNFVTEKEEFPAAVLIRGIWPVEGLDEMRRRRPAATINELSNGPAKLCQALGIDGTWNGDDVCSTSSRLFVEIGFSVGDKSVITEPRVGINNVPEPWRSKPWRFRINPEVLQYHEEFTF